MLVTAEERPHYDREAHSVPCAVWGRKLVCPMSPAHAALESASGQRDRADPGGGWRGVLPRRPGLACARQTRSLGPSPELRDGGCGSKYPR